MKKDIVLIGIASLLYSYIFYLQTAGINFLIFTALLIGFQIANNTRVIYSNTWLIATVGGVVSAISIFMYGNALSVTANVFSLLAMSFTAFSAKNSIPIGLFHSIYSIGASVVFVVLDPFSSSGPEKSKDRKNRWSWGRLIFYFLIPGVALIIFFQLYRQGNNVFEQLTESIDLSFISAKWLFFLVSGSFLMYGFFRHHVIPPFQSFDEGAENNLKKSAVKKGIDKLLDVSIEKKSGVVLLVLLNLLLLIVNSGDLVFISGGAELPDGMSLSDSVHQGVGALITSIVFAVLIILFYFRGRLNFIQNNKQIKALAVCWIVQNLLLVVSTAYRNFDYISAHGLTYKRIGVYVYLLLTVIGLLFTLIKVAKIKTNWYLVRAVSWSFFIVLVLSPAVNWDRLVSRSQVQIAHEKKSVTDVNYLSQLSSECYPTLYSHAKLNHDEQLMHTIERKLGRYLMNRDSYDWRSYNLRDSDLDQFINKNFSNIEQQDMKDKLIEETLLFRAMW